MANGNPTALITGGTSRIGREMVLELAGAGWNVVAHTTNEASDRAKALVSDAKGCEGHVALVEADLINSDQVSGLYQKASAAFGAPQVLVNNASIYEDDAIGELEVTKFDAHYAIHVRTPVFLADAMAAHLPSDQEGLIVNIIDQRVWKPTPQALSYSLSKTALWRATQTLAQALAPRIRVNGIGPGPSFKATRQSEEEFAKQSRSVLLKRGPDASDFGQTVLYFWKTRSVTGQMVALDGGQHLAWETPDVLDVGE